MNTYERAFLRYLKIKELKEDRQIIQSGGVLETVQIGKHKMEYDITSYGNDTIDLLAIAKKKANDKQPCFMMTITPGGNSELQSISRGISCFEDAYDNSLDIVLAALEIAKLKGAKTFEFTDNSTKTVNGKKLRLADLSFLTTGKTWYERIMPIRPSKKEEYDDFGNIKKLVLNNKWIDVDNKLLQFGVEERLDAKGIDINEPGSAMKVLSRAKESKKHHQYFFDNMIKIIRASGITALQGVHWIMDIQ